MRPLVKSEKPQILIDKEESWKKTYLSDPTEYNKRRYRDQKIKEALKKETFSKCIYCESKIGHNTPGDIEHKKPVSKFPDLVFDWDNLTIACTECNRRKNDYYSASDDEQFIDPYKDNVDNIIIHHGPIVFAKQGYPYAEISIRILELNNHLRLDLIVRKIEKINEIDERIKRINAESNSTLKFVLKKSLLELSEIPSEFSGMIRSILIQQEIL